MVGPILTSNREVMASISPQAPLRHWAALQTMVIAISNGSFLTNQIPAVFL